MRLILCCDYGLDDALATCDVLLHAPAEDREVTLVAVGGNVPAAVSLANAKKLVAHFPHPLSPVTIVDTSAEAQPACFLKEIHGEDGMGELFPEAQPPCPVQSFGEFLRDLSGPYLLLSLGPMTLIPRILARGVCEKFLFMGGNIAEQPNYHGYEFNHALDRAAFSRAVRHPHTAVTMDTCRRPQLNIQEESIAGEGILFRIARRIRDMTRISGEKGCYVWDDIAVKVLRHPDWFLTEQRTDRDGNLLTVAKYVLGKPYLEIMEQ